MKEDAARSHRGEDSPGIGLVLAGGAARGAYEVGVLEHLVNEVASDLGYEVPLDILCGSSVGAINACMMAALADQPRTRVAHLAAVWTSLSVDELLRPATRSLFDVARGVFGRGTSILEAGALLDPRPLADLLHRSIPFDRIDGHLHARRVRAVTVTATQVATGRSVVFVQRHGGHPSPWPESHPVIARAARLRAIHTLASSALPLLFPPVPIDGRYYSDGGLIQNVPLSPARRLGARALIVINPRHADPPDDAVSPVTDPVASHEPAPTALTLLGKTLNALLVDRIDNELDRFEKINAILEAGTRVHGPSFTESLNRELGFDDRSGLQRLDVVHLRSSTNIPQLAAEFVQHPRYHVPGVIGRMMKRVAHDDSMNEGDLLSYLLFDGEFAGRLIEVGRMDARTHHEALCRVVNDAVVAHRRREARAEA